MYHVIFDILHSNVENSITKVSLYYIIIDWGCLCLWQSERNQKYGWRYISWYNEAMYSTAWTFNYVKTTLTWSLTSISSLRYLINKRHGIVSWKRQHHGQSIHPTEKFTSMNLYKILWIVKWAWLFLTFMEAVRGQTQYSDCTLWQCRMDRTLSWSAKVCSCCMVFGL